MASVETSRSDRRAGRPSALWLLFGPTVWAAHFMILYLAHTLLCAVGGPGARPVVTTVVIVATVVALAAVAIPWLWARSPLRQPAGALAVFGFLRGATAWLTLLSVIAIVLTGATALIVAACS